MHHLDSNLSTSPSCGSTAVAGGLTATVVAVLLTGPATARAQSRPAPPEPVPVTSHPVDAATQNCFIGQLHWVPGMGRQPQCTVAERVASFPVG